MGIQSETITIVGGGYGGISLAKRLAQEKKSLRLITNGSHHELKTNWHLVASGEIPAQALRIPYSLIFQDLAVEVIEDEIEKVDPSENKLIGQKESYAYETLVWAGGQQSPAQETTEHLLSFRGLDDAIAIKNRLERSQDLKVVLIGAGLTGLELATHLTSAYPAHHFYLLGRSMPGKELSPKAQEKLWQEMPEKLTLVSGQVTNISGKVIYFEESQAKLNAPLGQQQGKSLEGIHQPNLLELPSGSLTADVIIQTVSGPTSLPQGLSRADFEDWGLLSKGREKDIYLLGDALRPKGVEEAHEQARQLADYLLDKEKPSDASLQKVEKTKPHRLVSLGDHRAVAEVPWVFWGPFAWMLKLLVDSFYVMGLHGGAGLDYFALRSGWLKSLMDQGKNRIWFLVPLRLFIGGLWLFSGYKKILGPATLQQAIGNFQGFESLFSFLTPGSDSWFSGTVQLPFDWLASADVLTSATVKAAHGGGVELSPLLEWLLRTILPNTAVALAFQMVFVVAEVLLGLCLILGLFTVLSGLVSAGLDLAFVLMGLGSPTMLWLLPGSLALLAKAGRRMGLDAFLWPRVAHRIRKRVSQRGAMG